MGILLVYDITDAASFELAEGWLARAAGKAAAVALVGGGKKLKHEGDLVDMPLKTLVHLVHILACEVRSCCTASTL